jgi:glucokinase
MRIGVDLGGTNMRVGLIDGATLVNKVIEPCPSKGTEDEVLNQLKRQIAQLMSPEVTSIGIGVPSVVDSVQGIVYNVANIPSWKEVHLKEQLEREFGIPVAVNNDANCFALGVWKYGEGQGTKDMVGLTMGTGIGSGIIINGELYNGVNTGAGEIGSLPFKDADYEFYCSSRFFSELHGDTGANFGKRAQEGDAEAVAVWNEFGGNVGELIKAVLFTYAPEAIIIGGGIASAFPLFETAMRASLESFPYPANVSATRIMPSTMPHAAIIGASLL